MTEVPRPTDETTPEDPIVATEADAEAQVPVAVFANVMLLPMQTAAVPVIGGVLHVPLPFIAIE